jgi:hypothetical protein
MNDGPSPKPTNDGTRRDTGSPSPEDLEAETARLGGEDATVSEGAWSSRVRNLTAVALMVLTGFSAVGAAVAVWVHQTLFDTESFTEIVVPTVLDPEVKAAYADYASDELIDALDVRGRLSDRLSALEDYLLADRPLVERLDLLPLEALAVPIADAVDDTIRSSVDAVVFSPQYDRLLAAAIPAAHSVAIALARGDRDLPAVVVESGGVSINTVPLLAEVLRRTVNQGIDLIGIGEAIPEFSSAEDAAESIARLATALGVDLPDGFGQYTILEEGTLSELQTAVDLLDRLVWAAVIVTVLFIAATIAVAARRRRATVQVGLSVVIGLGLAWVVTRSIEDAVVDRIATPGNREAASVLVGGVADDLQTWLLILVSIAAIVAVVAVLTGRSGRIRSAWERSRQRLADGNAVPAAVRRHYDMLRGGGAIVAFLILVVFGLDFFPVVIAGVLLTGYLGALAVLRGRAPDEASIPIDESRREAADG